MKNNKPSRCGLIVAGSWSVEHTKMIASYPSRGQGTDIQSQFFNAAGSAYPVLASLAQWRAPFPLIGAGLVGKDADGSRLTEGCRRHKIDVRLIGSTARAATSCTDVMVEPSDGLRTSFHHAGTDALWDGAGLNFARSKSRIFHLGGLPRLNALNAPHPKFGSHAAALLRAAQQAGLKTSAEAVHDDNIPTPASLLSALKFADYCILGECAAARATGFKIRQSDGRINSVSLRHAAGALLQAGVSEYVILRLPEGGFIRTRKGGDVWQSSVKIPARQITGAGGAGQAFAAAILLGLHEAWDLPRCLMMAVCAAGAASAEPVGSDRVKPLAATLKLARKFGLNPPLPD